MSNYRHGDLCLVGIKKASVPKEIKKTDTGVIMKGSHGHDHSFCNGCFYPYQQDRFVFGFFKAEKDCKLFHPEHGVVVEGKVLREAEIPVGWYECRKQFEDTNEGMKPVID